MSWKIRVAIAFDRRLGTGFVNSALKGVRTGMVSRPEIARTFRDNFLDEHFSEKSNIVEILFGCISSFRIFPLQMLHFSFQNNIFCFHSVDFCLKQFL